ncbi:MAG: hypothetical protein IKQ45_05310 [Clostridia bacterium]|nr:hypothetical protein [Clostridia bacterium]
MKRTRHVVLLAFLLLAAALLTACGGGTSGTDNKKETEKTYTWNETSFTVKRIAEDKSEAQDEADPTKKRIAVVLDFGKGTLAQDKFEKEVSSGKILFAGKKPEKSYTYSMSSMTFSPGSGGFIAQLTGELTLFFEVDKDYEIKDSDLVIQE